MVSPKWQMRMTRCGPRAPMLRSVENDKGVFDYRLILFYMDVVVRRIYLDGCLKSASLT
jgi:hypothetical protein